MFTDLVCLPKEALFTLFTYSLFRRWWKKEHYEPHCPDLKYPRNIIKNHIRSRICRGLPMWKLEAGTWWWHTSHPRRPGGPRETSGGALEHLTKHAPWCLVSVKDSWSKQREAQVSANLSSASNALRLQTEDSAWFDVQSSFDILTNLNEGPGSEGS